MTKMAKKTSKKTAASPTVPKVATKENMVNNQSKKALRKALAAQKAQLLKSGQKNKNETQENQIVIAPVRSSDEPLVQTQVSYKGEEINLLYNTNFLLFKRYFRLQNGSTSSV